MSKPFTFSVRVLTEITVRADSKQEAEEQLLLLLDELSLRHEDSRTGKITPLDTSISGKPRLKAADE